MKYKVVIECCTYNQKEYIEDALKGFVMQKTNFPFCAVVIDDCSTDGQQEIIKEYARKYPEIIKPVFLPFNHYQAKKSKQEYLMPYFEQCEYIAKCEGDDYWINENKLQIQADFLDNHPDCALTYHACINRFEKNFKGKKTSIGESVLQQYDFEQLLKSYPFQTGTIMMRRSVWFDDFFQKCYNILSFSSIQFFAASQLGSVEGFNEQMSVYRRNAKGISNDNDLLNKNKGLFYSWLKIGDLCKNSVRKTIHKIVMESSLKQISILSFEQFIELSKIEILRYPSVVLNAVMYKIKYEINKLFA